MNFYKSFNRQNCQCWQGFDNNQFQYGCTGMWPNHSMPNFNNNCLRQNPCTIALLLLLSGCGCNRFNF